MLARAVLAAGIATCLAAWIAGAPIPYFDYDDATLGIFVNDLSFHGDLDASFEGTDGVDRFRVGWAAQRLPFTLPLSWIERALGLAPWQVEDLLRAAALCFGLAGSLLAARVLLPPPRFGAGARWALVAALAAHPSLALFARTGASFFLFVYALFWLGTLAAFRALEGFSLGWIYIAGGVAALCALNPYPPLLCLPLATALLAAWEGRLAAALRNRHVWAAAALGLAAAGAVTAALAAAYDTSLPAFLDRLASFRAGRGHAVALSQLISAGPLEKLTKLLNQQWLFRWDLLGDRTRKDFPWTLGAFQPVILLWALLAAAGILAALRERSPEDRRALSVAAAVLLLFFSLSFPEGRYVLVLLPCWGYFGLRGVGLVARRNTPRQLALGLALLCLCGATEWRIRQTYLPMIHSVWQNFEGMRQIAPILAALPQSQGGLLMAMPYKEGQNEMQFRMLMPAGIEWPLPRRFLRELARPQPGVRFAALAYADRPLQLAEFLSQGFTRRAELRGEASGRALWLLVREPPAPAAAGAPQ